MSQHEMRDGDWLVEELETNTSPELGWVRIYSGGGGLQELSNRKERHIPSQVNDTSFETFEIVRNTLSLKP